VKVWDAQTGKELLSVIVPADEIDVPENEVYLVVWNAAGTRIAAASEHSSVKVWDAQTGAEVYSLGENTVYAKDVAWNAAGTRILTSDGVVVWDAQTGVELYNSGYNTAWVRQAAWDPAGTRIATASSDGTVKVWDAQTGTKLLTRDEKFVYHLAWNPAGTRIAIASGGSARIFFAEIDGPGGLVEFACTRTGRNLAQDEWERYIGDDVPYRATCSNLPPDLPSEPTPTPTHTPTPTPIDTPTPTPTIVQIPFFSPLPFLSPLPAPTTSSLY
jgi:WD40 repeat protein